MRPKLTESTMEDKLIKEIRKLRKLTTILQE